MRKTRYEVVQGLLELYPAPRYLEIGVHKGVTFQQVTAAAKVAVDPVFLFDVEEAARREPNAVYHAATSDAYFAAIIGRDELFDVIFLDGLHVAEQTLRDFNNATVHLKPEGVIVIDDVRPASYLASLSDRASFVKLRKHLGVKAGTWMGDVYKVVFFIETFCPGFDYRTIADNHGQTVVWRARRARVPERALQAIGGKSFADTVVERDVYRLRSFAEIRAEVQAFVAGAR